MRIVHGSPEQARQASIPPAEVPEVEALRVEVAELRSSRRRLVDAGDEARRRLERDLHDGTQQRLYQVGLELERLRRTIDDAATRGVAPGAEIRTQLDEAELHVRLAITELRELVAGVHPTMLTTRGIEEALRSLTRRSPIPVSITSELETRPAPEVERAAYFVTLEAFHNAIRHSEATAVDIRLRVLGPHLVVEVVDDGVGGANPERGSGLVGLGERVHVLDGALEVTSPRGGGTRVRVLLPLDS